MDAVSPDRPLDVVLAEYEFVTGLIRYYREVELRAFAATGIVLSGVAAVYGALESADDPKRGAQAILLCIASWVPALLLLIVLMAKARGLRGVFYVRDHLRLHAIALTGDDHLLRWEVSSASILRNEMERGLHASRLPVIARPVMSTGVMSGLLSGMPLIVMMFLAALGLSVGGVLIDTRPETVFIGGGAALTGIALAAVGLAFTHVTDWAYATVDQGAAGSSRGELLPDPPRAEDGLG